MPSESEPRHQASPIDLSSQVDPQSLRAMEAVSDYRVASNTIDKDTRLASAGDTESIWPGRPARVSVIRSAQRDDAKPSSRRKPALFRGDDGTSHSRRDLLTGDWTIFAPKRDERPNEYATGQEFATGQTAAAETATVLQNPHGDVTDAAVDAGCPFCRGAESQTPEAVWSARLGDLASPDSDHASTRFARPLIHIAEGEQERWDVRVVPNKFPAVSAMNPCGSIKNERNSLFPIAEVVGGHEVIIESSSHAETMTQFDPALVYVTLMAYRDRIRHWRDIPGINYISVFKNCGPEAGASLRHTHSQLVATSLMPYHIRSSMLRCEHHRARTGCSLGCDLVRAELAEKSRIIDCTDSMVAFCPFASRFAGLVRITSIAHQPHFEALPDESLDQLASFLFRVLTWVGQAFPGKAFNYLLHTCPPGSGQPESFQWSLDVFPRLNKTAGFEWSSDCMINSLLPEAAAARYRDIARQNDPRQVMALR